jgi:hypothetical protein
MKQTRLPCAFTYFNTEVVSRLCVHAIAFELTVDELPAVPSAIGPNKFATEMNIKYALCWRVIDKPIITEVNASAQKYPQSAYKADMRQKRYGKKHAISRAE